MTESIYSETYHFKSRSVAAISEVWTCNLSPPRNESGMYGSGGIFKNGKDEMKKTGGFESGEACRSDESPGMGTSPNERPS